MNTATESKESIFDDLEKLRLSPADLGGASGVRVMTHVPLRKPQRHEFFRVDPDPTKSITTAIYMDKAEMRNDAHLVLPVMHDALAGEMKPTLLVPFITRQEVYGLWPIALPTDDGRRNDWYETAREAYERAKTQWVRMAADMSLGGYRVYEAVGVLPDPVWPDKPFKEVLEIAFRGRIISSEDQPVVRRLRGAV